MRWKLKEVKQVTFNPFLNYFILVYEIQTKEGIKEYPYYMVSRRKKEELVCLTKEYHRVDGIVMALYHIDEDTGQISLLITKQFRPTVNRYVNSFVAGLIDKEDHDIKQAIQREAREEAGVTIDDIEILTSPGTTSVGISDEINIVAMARITSFGDTSLEEDEDIATFLVKLKDLKRSFEENTQEYFFPVNIKILILYLLQRFKDHL